MDTEYIFDEIFDDSSKQIDLHRSIISPIVKDIIKGYNSTLFAYGAYGSGKNYTMTGNTTTTNNLGIMPIAINELFQSLNHMNVEFNIRISYLEILNEELVDLLTDQMSHLKLYENAKGQTNINGLTEVIVTNVTDAISILLNGQQRMKSGSRSHSIFTILLYIKECQSVHDSDVEIIKFSKLNLVKLAGNESVYKNAYDLVPRIKLNQSLMSFNRVVNSLIEKNGHVPYRDSKLTRILQESLGGNSKTSIIATISPGNICIEETVNTLEFASRAKHIINRPQINERINKSVMLQNITNEINRLKQDIQANLDRSGVFLTENLYSESMDQLNQSVKSVKIQKYEVKSLENQLKILQHLFDNRYTDLNKQIQQIDKINRKIEKLQLNYKILSHVALQRDNAIAEMKDSEKQLTNQAKNMENIVVSAILDAENIHKSLDKRQQNDILFEEEKKRFNEDIQMQIENMKDLLKQHAQNLEEMIKIYFEKYGKFVEIFLFVLFISSCK